MFCAACKILWNFGDKRIGVENAVQHFLFQNCDKRFVPTQMCGFLPDSVQLKFQNIGLGFGVILDKQLCVFWKIYRVETCLRIHVSGNLLKGHEKLRQFFNIFNFFVSRHEVHSNAGTNAQIGFSESVSRSSISNFLESIWVWYLSFWHFSSTMVGQSGRSLTFCNI